MIIKYILFSFFLTIILSCQEKDRWEEMNNKAIGDFRSNSNYQKDIPMNKNGSPNHIYSRFVTSLKKSKLNRIDTLEKKFMIRVFHDFNNSGSLQILSMEFEHMQWEGKYYSYKNVLNDSIRNHLIWRNIEPKNGWSKCIHDLFSANILYLPSMNNIEFLNALDIADGGVIYIEIADENVYRFYYFYEPTLLKEYCNLKECKQVVKIFEILNSNFNFKE